MCVSTFISNQTVYANTHTEIIAYTTNMQQRKSTAVNIIKHNRSCKVYNFIPLHIVAYVTVRTIQTLSILCVHTSLSMTMLHASRYQHDSPTGLGITLTKHLLLHGYHTNVQ